MRTGTGIFIERERLVVRTRADGRHVYGKSGKASLVAACGQPGASAAAVALAHGVNANLVRNGWSGKARAERSSGKRRRWHSRQGNACNTISQAAVPARPLAWSYATAVVLSHVLTSKYADHLPHYRQARSTRVKPLNCRVQPSRLWVALQRYVLAAGKQHADHTPVPVLQPRRGTTKTARLRTYVRDDRALAVGQVVTIRRRHCSMASDTRLNAMRSASIRMRRVSL